MGALARRSAHPWRVRVGRDLGHSRDPAGKTSYEVAVAVFGGDEPERTALLAIGEVKWNEIMDVSHLRRLERSRSALRTRDAAKADDTRLLCFSGAGFTKGLRDLAAQDETIQLVDLDRLYHGN